MSSPLPSSRPGPSRLRLVRGLTRPSVGSLAQSAVASACRHPARAAAALGIAAALAVAAAVWSAGSGAAIATAPVREGPFRVTIVETGTLQALRSVTYASTIVSNQAKIVAIAPEGQLVKKGDLLLLFDASPFEEEIRKSQAQLAQAEADFQKAQQDLKLQEIQNREELASARQKVERSVLTLRDVQEGQGRLKEEESEAAVANADRELAKARAAVEDLKPLLAEGFITVQEMERASQAVERAEQERALALRRRDALMKYARPVEVSQAVSEAGLTQEGLKQLQSSASFRLEQKKAAIAAAQSRIDEASSRLAQARQQLARTELRADVPGIVVYRPVFFGSEQRKPQVGDQVWANQPLLILPDISRMVVETRVRETDVHKVERKQRVGIRVDAYPDLRLSGTVNLVGTLAQEDAERRAAKFFGVTILVNESEPRLRPGMTARVEIEAEERPRALAVPLEAVFRKDGRALCYVMGRFGGVRPREVVLGPSNEHFVVIEKGLAAGEKVCLRDPTAPPTDQVGLAPAS